MSQSTSIRASARATADLRRLSYALSAELGERVTLGVALEAAVTMAARDTQTTLATVRELLDREAGND